MILRTVGSLTSNPIAVSAPGRSPAHRSTLPHGFLPLARIMEHRWWCRHRHRRSQPSNRLVWRPAAERTGRQASPRPGKTRAAQAIYPPSSIVRKSIPPRSDAPCGTVGGKCRMSGNGSWSGPSSPPTGRMAISASIHLGAVAEPIAGFLQTQAIAQGLTTVFRLRQSTALQLRHDKCGKLKPILR